MKKIRFNDASLQMQYNDKMSIAEKLLDWYSDHARDLPWRQDQEPYHVWVSEIMLQQTRARAVIPYYRRFIKTLPTVQVLAETDEDSLMKLWEGLGYYSRARNLQKAAIFITQECGGIFPSTYEEILRLPGVGSYTAGAIASICFDLPMPAVDGNVLRIIARLLEIEDSVDETSTKNRIRELLIEVYRALPSQECGEFTQALMELGAIVCIPNSMPLCSECPINKFCISRQKDTVMQFPIRTVKQQKSDEEITVILLRCDGKIAIRKRPQKGLLAGMWEFPNVKTHITEADALIWATEQGVSPHSIKSGSRHTHIFTHIRWHMRSFEIECAETTAPVNSKLSNDLVWATPEELSDVYALPTAFRKFIAT